MNEFVMIFGMALVTYLIRVIIFPISKRVMIPASVVRALRYVPPAVLTAIIIPSVLIPDGNHLNLSYRSPYIVGSVIAVVLGMLTKNLLLTIISGMIGFLLWRWLM